MIIQILLVLFDLIWKDTKNKEIRIFQWAADS
jgi:hypothetical protein